MEDEWQVVKDALTSAGVKGVVDLGRFVSNTQYFEPSKLDERAAAPVLLRLLPTLQDAAVVEVVGRHLQGPWLRMMNGAYEVVRQMYVRWAPRANETGWVLGDTLCKAAQPKHAEDLLGLASIDEHGMARGCIVEALWRFKSTSNVEPLLRELTADPSVTYAALSSLQRTIGAEAMVPVLEALADQHDDPVVVEAAGRQLRRVRKKLARS